MFVFLQKLFFNFYHFPQNKEKKINEIYFNNFNLIS
jgi:hypothetical protein